MFAFLLGATMALTLTSPAFEEGKEIPEKYTCDGENISPPLDWKGDLPATTQSFVLICDDHDVPADVNSAGVWDHWVLFNISVGTHSLEEGVKKLPPGTLCGKNSGGKNEYTGPCPPDREHRYEFKLYALDIEKLNLDEGATKAEVEEAMKEHILDKRTLMGRYDKRERREKRKLHEEGAAAAK